MPKINETAIELHRELSRRGLELNPKIGRDAALHAALAAKLKLPTSGFSKALAASKISAEEYLRDLMEIAQPFALMFQKIWSYLSMHCAPKADESLFVRFGFDKDNPRQIDWDQFRVMVETARKVWSMGPVVLWPSEELFGLENVLKRAAGPRPDYPQRYEIGRPFELPRIEVLTPEDEVAERVRKVLQSWIDAVAAAWPMDDREDRRLPELKNVGLGDESENRRPFSLRDIAYLLTDLVPGWRTILDRWDAIPQCAKLEATSYYEKRIVPKLSISVAGAWRSTFEALDVLELPFWKHRWHTYEVWASITALEALDGYEPVLVVKDGYVALDAASPALVARLTANQPIFAHVQGKTELSTQLGKRKAIKPDLRFSLADPSNNEDTIAIVEFKQRANLDPDHASEVLRAYSLGVGRPGGVVLINYDAIPVVTVPTNCVFIGNVRPDRALEVAAYQRAVRDCFECAGFLPMPSKRFVLLDVSGSMNTAYGGDAAQRGLQRVCSMSRVKVFRFNDGLVEGGDLKSGSRIATSGGTDLGGALQQLYSLTGAGIPDRMIIVTDGGHDHPSELLDRSGAYVECRPEDLETHLDWLIQDEV